MAHATPRLKLLHATGAGVDSFCLSALGPQTTVANAYFHGPAIGEYVMMMILALSRDLRANGRALSPWFMVRELDLGHRTPARNSGKNSGLDRLWTYREGSGRAGASVWNEIVGHERTSPALNQDTSTLMRGRRAAELRESR